MTDPLLPTPLDAPWKQVLEQLFPEFVAFFLPVAHQEIDWEKGYELLDTELQAIVREADVGLRLADKLVRVYRRGEGPSLVYVHVEVQGQVDPDFARRMFVYHYRIRDRHDERVFSLAVLGDLDPEWRPAGFGYELWGCRLQFDFPVFKLIDWESRREELEASVNPFGIIVLGHLAARETARDGALRLSEKVRLVRRLYERGFSRAYVIAVFGFLDWLMVLPRELEEPFRVELARMEKEKQMPYVTSVERLAKAEGLEQGIERGRRESIVLVLTARFGSVPESVRQRLQVLQSEATVAELLAKAATAGSLGEFEAALGA